MKTGYLGNTQSVGMRPALLAAACLACGLVGCAGIPSPIAGAGAGAAGPGSNAPPGAPLAGVSSWLAPSNDRDWSPDQAILSRVEYQDNLARVFNVRHCDYRSADQYAVRHYDKTFDLDSLASVDYIVVPFSDLPGGAHTFLSFGFDGGDYLAVSVEIRKEQGEVYKPLSGVLRQYEIMYVVGDERDLIGLRANHRRDDVHVYRIRASREKVRALFADVVDRVNKLEQAPEFYNTLSNNCTTNILDHVNRVLDQPLPYSIEILLPGYSDRLAYDAGLLETKGSFEETRLAARVNKLAYIHRDSPDFSRKIRGE